MEHINIEGPVEFCDEHAINHIGGCPVCNIQVELEKNNYGHDRDCPLSPCICHVAEEEEEEPITYITITGHRPSKLGGYNPNNPLNVKVYEALEAKMLNAVAKFGKVVFRIGMAIGTDQMAAHICVKHNLPFDAYIPCKEQESRWPKAAQDEYRKLLTYARDVYTTHPDTYPGAWVMRKRNKAMINGHDRVQTDYLLSVYDGTAGGTANCVQYAQDKGVTIVNINPREL